MSNWSYKLTCESDIRLNTDKLDAGGGRFAAIDKAQLRIKEILHKEFQEAEDIAHKYALEQCKTTEEEFKNLAHNTMYIHSVAYIHLLKFHELVYDFLPDDLYATFYTDDDMVIDINCRDAYLIGEKAEEQIDE